MEEQQPVPEASETQENTPAKGKKKIWKRVAYGALAVLVAVLCFLGGMLTYSLTLDDEIRSLVNLKAAIQTNYYEDISDEEFYDTVFDAINAQLLDAYSQYMTADEYSDTQTEATGQRSGVGIVFSTADASGNARMFVSRVCGNSPAEEAGISEGDYVLGFGKTESEMTDSVVFDELADFLATCQTDEPLYLKVKTGDSVRNVQLRKSIYVENYVFYRTNTAAYRFTGAKATTETEGGKPLAKLGDDTAYIRLTQFNGNAAAEFKSAMNRFKTDGKKNLVLDLRGNGGGYLDILQEIASYFCKGTDVNRPLVAVANYKGGKSEKYYASSNLYQTYFASDSRICVLADSLTASASEALIGCMVDYKATSYADVCLSYRGEEAKTYGKGIMQTTFPFGLGRVDAVKLTTAKLYWPLSSTCIHGVGVTEADGTKTVGEDESADSEINAALGVLFGE